MEVEKDEEKSDKPLEKEVHEAEEEHEHMPDPVTPTREYMDGVLRCPLCLDIFLEPIGTVCGHTFCRACLGDSLKRLKKCCPVCRAPCMLDVAKIKENSTISQLVKEVFPRELMIKKKEAVTVGLDSPLMPVFSYGRATFPGEAASFRFFEPRYRLMCQRIIASGSMEFVYYSGSTEPRPDALCHVLRVTKMEYLEGEGVYNVEVLCPHEASRAEIDVRLPVRTCASDSPRFTPAIR